MIQLSTGSILDSRYQLIERRAEGASATVWMARDETLGRLVAVKVLHPQLAVDDSIADRFAAEALTGATVNHPGLVAVYDTVTDPVAAIILEWIDGPDLRSRLDDRPMTAGEVSAMGASLADALAALHAAGLVHRDVKPANIMFTNSGLVKLTDFGIATSGQHDMTATGMVLGTAKYLAPEQVRGHSIDGRSDIYALCVVLYEALTGQAPFQRDTDIATALARLEGSPADPRTIKPRSPTELVEAIMVGLEIDPRRRWPSASALAAALRSPTQHAPTATMPEAIAPTTALCVGQHALAPSPTPSLSPARRPWWPRIVGFALASAVAAMGIYLIVAGAQSLTG